VGDAGTGHVQSPQRRLDAAQHGSGTPAAAGGDCDAAYGAQDGISLLPTHPHHVASIVDNTRGTHADRVIFARRAGSSRAHEQPLHSYDLAGVQGLQGGQKVAAGVLRPIHRQQLVCSA
jgi:hypothetical protein